MTFHELELRTYVSSRLPDLKQAAKEFRGSCPVHKGRNPQLLDQVRDRIRDLPQPMRQGSYQLAIRLVGAKRRRLMSSARLEALEKARLASPLIPTRTVQDGNYTA